ncbi:TetR/AcrR family transcriptional regulator [Microlunatus soli]|nr:TetR/AcrR family transcriptional regulator [Microlunatus soli]
MARRGEALREHILDSAKLAFLESGFSGTSMDGIAARARTSKRSLYAHFETKDALLIAVVQRMRTLFEDRIRTPGDYSDDPAEAVTKFCARVLQLIRWSNVALTLRIGIAEADRLPELAGGLHDALFATTEERLRDYLRTHCQRSDDEAAMMTGRIIGLVVYPALPRVLFGLDPLQQDLGELGSRAVEDVQSLAGTMIALATGTADG